MNLHFNRSELLGIAGALVLVLGACTHDPSAGEAEAASGQALTSGVRLSPAASAALEQLGIAALTADQLKRLDTDHSGTLSVDEVSVWLDAVRSSNCGGSSSSSSGGTSSGGSSGDDTGGGGSSCVES